VPTRDENDIIKARLVELSQDLGLIWHSCTSLVEQKNCFSSISSSIGGAEALVKGLASNKKQ
jgi:hypothetical protein